MLKRTQLYSAGVFLASLAGAASAVTLGEPIAMVPRAQNGSALTLFAVPIPVRSYRLLSMSMDDEGTIWTGSRHQVIHRYDPVRGRVENINLPFDVVAASCLCAGKKVYILGQTYPKLVSYNRSTHQFHEFAYPGKSPNVWYGYQASDQRYLYLFDRQSSGVIKWDTHDDSYTSVPYPFKSVFPAGGRYEPRDGAIWCNIINLTDDLYAPIGHARLDLATNRFTDYYPMPKDDENLQPYDDPATTLYWVHNLRGKVIPFDFKARRFCKFIDVPGFGKDFGFIGGPTSHNGRYYFSLSTYNGTGSCDGKPHHFLNGFIEFDPVARAFHMLKLDTKGSYYQLAYMLSAGGDFFVTGANILESDGSLNMDRKGEVLFWQTLQPQPNGK